MRNNKKGFTLVEVIVVMVIMGIMATLVAGNFVSSLKKGRDAKRKSDMEQVQKALDLYYNDNEKYPADSDVVFGNSLQTASRIYMQRLPKDPGTCRYYYVHSASPEGYSLYSTLENINDSGPGTGNYGANCPSGANSCTCRFKLTSPNLQ